MGLTPKQAWAIGHLVNELRPEWQAEGVVAALKRVADRNPFTVALAAVRAAADTDARTPGVIPTEGTHWQDGIKQQPAPRNHNVPCPLHPSEILPCGRCANDAIPAEKSTTPARIRAELASTRSNLCSHGVDPKLCNDHRAELAAARRKTETPDAEEATHE